MKIIINIDEHGIARMTCEGFKEEWRGNKNWWNEHIYIASASYPEIVFNNKIVSIMVYGMNKNMDKSQFIFNDYHLNNIINAKMPEGIYLKIIRENVILRNDIRRNVSKLMRYITN